LPFGLKDFVQEYLLSLPLQAENFIELGLHLRLFHVVIANELGQLEAFALKANLQVLALALVAITNNPQRPQLLRGHGLSSQRLRQGHSRKNR